MSQSNRLEALILSVFTPHKIIFGVISIFIKTPNLLFTEIKMAKLKLI